MLLPLLGIVSKFKIDPILKRKLIEIGGAAKSILEAFYFGRGSKIGLALGVGNAAFEIYTALSIDIYSKDTLSVDTKKKLANLCLGLAPAYIMEAVFRVKVLGIKDMELEVTNLKRHLNIDKGEEDD